MGDRHYGGSKATSSTGGVGNTRGNAAGAQWPAHGLDARTNGNSTPHSRSTPSYRSNDYTKRADTEALMGESGHDYPNKKKAPLVNYNHSMPGNISSSSAPIVPMYASHMPSSHFPPSQGSTAPISGRPTPSHLHPNGGPLHPISPLHAVQGHPSTVSPYAPMMQFYSKPAANGEFVDPLAAPKELLNPKKATASVPTKPVTNISATTTSHSSFADLGMTSLLPPSKLAATTNNTSDSSSANDTTKEYGSVAFSFDKSTKPSIVPQSLLSKSKLVSSASSAPTLPHSAAPSSVHKPGGHIAFIKPVVVPKKSGLVSSYRARRDDDDDEETPPTPPPEPTEPEKVPVEEPSTSNATSQPSTTSSTQEKATLATTTSQSASNAVSSTATQSVASSRQNKPPSCGMRNLDSFKIVELISEGSYGVVYKAIDSESGEMVALKKVKVDPMKEKDTGFPVSSIREIKALGFLRNETIVNLRDVISDASGAVIYLVMDYVPHDLHQKLKQHLKKARPTPIGNSSSAPSSGPSGNSPAPPATIEPLFTIANSKSLMYQLLESMAFLHSKNYMHRDIKSANLLVSDEGKLYLADFGLTKEWTQTGKRQRTPTVVTITYRAPELAFGAPDYTTAIDMWSVGLVMCELITGKELMRGVKNEIELMSKLVEIFGTPNESNFGKGYSQLAVNQPNTALSLKPQPENKLRNFVPNLSRQGFDLLSRLLCYDPDKRITAEQALLHPWFKELPTPMKPFLGPAPPTSNPTPPPTQLAPVPPQQPPPQYYPPHYQPYNNQRPPQDPYYGYGGRAPDRYPTHHQGPPVPYHDPYYAPQHAAPPPHGRFQQDPRRSHRGRPEYR